MEIAQAGPADRAALLPLLAEMGRFYAERTDAATLAAAAEALTTSAGRAGPFCLVARDGTGFVSLSGFFPAFDFTWGLLLKDLYVAEAARGTGVARALMTGAMRFARERGYTRIDWTTDATNARARRFYAGLGVVPAGKIFYRVTGEALARAAAGAWPEGNAA
ncbi:GNAT family N-acetyltransferase [Roseomonas sp. PWR1]|uniref:GNAT family N-acetyltransferase n=1 Tax=Roseomonas nitratireducens TaxID=2820810 RepID=A0ABS4ATR8_9PROT|nr:GNAT family N-acetyltransferase [Neoroseomonas nitratireducens]MBP0464765.1 GNAT family N-acetyltransferase [Neoroseomonas nitratireducens]